MRTADLIYGRVPPWTLANMGDERLVYLSMLESLSEAGLPLPQQEISELSPDGKPDSSLDWKAWMHGSDTQALNQWLTKSRGDLYDWDAWLEERFHSEERQSCKEWMESEAYGYTLDLWDALSEMIRSGGLSSRSSSVELFQGVFAPWFDSVYSDYEIQLGALVQTDRGNEEFSFAFSEYAARYQMPEGLFAHWLSAILSPMSSLWERLAGFRPQLLENFDAMQRDWEEGWEERMRRLLAGEGSDSKPQELSQAVPAAEETTTSSGIWAAPSDIWPENNDAWGSSSGSWGRSDPWADSKDPWAEVSSSSTGRAKFGAGSSKGSPSTVLSAQDWPAFEREFLVAMMEVGANLQLFWTAVYGGLLMRFLPELESEGYEALRLETSVYLHIQVRAPGVVGALSMEDSVFAALAKTTGPASDKNVPSLKNWIEDALAMLIVVTILVVALLWIVGVF